MKFDWWLFIDKDYIIVNEFLFISKIWSTSKLLENGSSQVARFLLKLNEPKFSIGLKDIPYLGYIISQEGITPYPKKL